MAVYTQISELDLTRFLNAYDIGDLVEYKGITQGVTNTSYFLRTTAGRFVLTIYEHRVREKDLPLLMDIILGLCKNGFPSATPILDVDGHSIGRLKGKPASLQSFLDGNDVKETTVGLCSQLGAWTARLHRLTKDAKALPDNPLPPTLWKHLIDQVSSDQWKDVIVPELDFLLENYPENLPAGFIHGDLFPDNVLMENGFITGIIDFNYACKYIYAYELAQILNSWCFSPDGLNFDRDKAKAFFKSYQSYRPMTREEKDNFALVARGGAMRIIATRYFDWANTASDAKVVKKNPEDYVNILKFHQAVKDPAIYGFEG